MSPRPRRRRGARPGGPGPAASLAAASATVRPGASGCYRHGDGHVARAWRRLRRVVADLRRAAVRVRARVPAIKPAGPGPRSRSLARARGRPVARVTVNVTDSPVRVARPVPGGVLITGCPTVTVNLHLDSGVKITRC